MKTTRRHALRQTSAATLGTLLPGCASTPAATTLPTAPSAASTPAAEVQPLPFDPAGLTGLSERLIRSHHENNYAGAVRKLNEARAALASLPGDAHGFVRRGLHAAEHTFQHSVVLHEQYFGTLVGGGSKGTQAQARLAEHFGGASQWEQRFGALGRALSGGSGWAVLAWDFRDRAPRMYCADDHAAGLSSGLPLIVLDMYEHAYHIDYGTAAAKYIDAFFANLHWEAVDRRLALALQIDAALADATTPP